MKKKKKKKKTLFLGKDFLQVYMVIYLEYPSNFFKYLFNPISFYLTSDCWA